MSGAARSAALRPEFIREDLFDEPLSRTYLNRLFTVIRPNGVAVLPPTFIREVGLPPDCRSGVQKWLPRDIIGRALDGGNQIGPPRRKERTIHDALKELLLLQMEVIRRAPSDDSITHTLRAAPIAQALVGGRLFRQHEIVRFASNISNADSLRQSGIYFLIRGGKIDYIGQSVNVVARISQHNPFEAWCYIPCDEADLDVLESVYIHCFDPPGNGKAASGNDKEKNAPMSRLALFELAFKRLTAT